ncbi:MAG TPA: 4a-hydroxytetrahydrobiopterin dehydratase [Acidobacteriota bacterium]|nr:4a-hydroxytetrahydrobiopterin dehydratase [Acidobacteriota bacterium]
MAKLAEKKCVACSGGTPPITADAIKPLLQQIRGWEVVDNHHIKKQFKFPDFKTALDFVNKVGEIAEEEDHHPDICFAWGKVEVTTWTHKAKGLTENDFILAAKIDRIR